MNLVKVRDCVWEIPQQGKMRVPGRIYASESMLRHIESDNAHQQVANVAHMPGILRYSIAMPDIHWGYGFPIGGVAAFDMEEGVISPGGVGYDINCGVRLMATKLHRDEVVPKMQQIVNQLFRDIPTGVGASGALSVSTSELRKVVTEGAKWAVAHGYGTENDLEYIEEQGCVRGAKPDKVSNRAWERAREQLGTLGSGNHFLEIGYVDEVYDEEAARAFGLELGQVTLLIHCGSRGFGHQICDDYLVVMDKAVRKYHISLPDRQLACAPIQSSEGQAYLGAMQCAINYAFANRQVIGHYARLSFAKALKATPESLGIRTVYEVAHNIAKIERHTVDGRERVVCVHRKGATRAFPAGSPEIPSAYRAVGQPVLVPGDMGRYSYVLVSTPLAMEETFGSACHGAGRSMSRHQAKRVASGRDIAGELRREGIIVQGQTRRTMAEEIPEAYKDVSEVVEATVRAGLAKKVVRLRPLGCIKG